MPIRLEENALQTDRRTDKWTDKTEIIGPYEMIPRTKNKRAESIIISLNEVRLNGRKLKRVSILIKVSFLHGVFMNVFL